MGYDHPMADEISVQVSFGEFWSWILRHPNCILRAGTPEIMIYDDLDFHWLLGRDEREVPNIQLYHGKRPMADFFLVEEAVDWVRGFPSDLEGEYIFELVHQEDGNSFVSYFFVMSHGMDEDENGDKVH